MNKFQELIRKWERREQEYDYKGFKSICRREIKSLKRLNLLFDCLDILVRSCGILMMIVGFFMFWFRLNEGDLLFLVDCVFILCGFKMAKGIEE